MRPVRRQRGEEAAAAVEFAILAPLVFMLIFGMLTGALAWNSKQTLTHAAREGARYAATLPGDPTNPWGDWLTEVQDVTRDAAFGELDGASAFICVAYVVNASGAGNVRDTDGDPSDFDDPGNDRCYADGRPDGQPRVQVVASREVMFNALLVIVPDLRLWSNATARHEPSAVTP